MRKHIIILFAAVMLLSGCRSHTELNEIAIAEAIGIDRNGDNGYTVTLQYFNTDTTGGTTAIDSSKPNAVTVSGSGETIESALEALSYTCGRSIMTGSAGLIVFGRDAAYDLRESLSFSMSHYSGDPRAFIAVSETTAADILNVKFSEGNASVEKLESMLRNAQELGLCRTVTLHEASEMLCGPTASAVLPLLRAADTGSELTDDGRTVTVTGGAVCTDDRYAAALTPEEMSGMCLLSERGAKCEMPVICRGRSVRVMIYGTSACITPSFVDGTMNIDIRVSGGCRIVSSRLPDPYSDRNAIESIAGREAERRLSSLIAATATALGADPAGLAYKIRAYSPALWDIVRYDYREHLKRARFTVSCDLRMERFA